MLYNQTAILTDLDGTLFNSNGLVSDSDRKAINDYIAAGGLFAIASGREPLNARRHLPNLSINGPSIMLNGAAVYDFMHHQFLNTVFMDQEAGADVVAHCKESGFPLDIQIYTTVGIFYASPLKNADPGFLRIHQPTSFLPLEQLLEKKWIKVVMLEREADALAPMRAYLKEKGYEKRLSLIEGTTDVVQIGKYQELLPPNLNKGTAVAFLWQIEEFKSRTLFAVGDYWNDLEMLKAVDVPCAPENAIDEIRAVCRYTLCSHNDSAIADLIRRVIPAVL